MLEGGAEIRTVQQLLGHKDVSRTMVPAHVLNRCGRQRGTIRAPSRGRRRSSSRSRLEAMEG
ncbi:MAG: hypothetical protein H0W53_04195 [Acidobacteria bacterium]|nr:hypothetical protein [Acidobacteriota bacterium]